MPFPKIRHRWRIPLLLVIVTLVVIQYCAFNIGGFKNSVIGLDHPTNIVNDDKHNPFASTEPIDEDIDPNLPHTVLQGVKGFRSSLPRIQRPAVNESEHVKSVRMFRQQAVKDAFIHTWNGYKKYAWGHDEVKPNSNGTVDGFGGWGATLVDSLSTMLVMELEDEFNETIDVIAGIDYNRTLYGGSISVFETVIRHLGGLISAYELSGNQVLLTKAEELGHALMPAFNTPYDLPHHNWYLTSQKSRDNFSLIAEVGTVQLEFMALSHHTGDPQYARKAKRIMDYVESMSIKEGLQIPGLYPTSMDVGLGTFTNFQVSFGGAGDSAFEYFLKQYLLVDGTVPQYKRMYIESMEGMRRYMLRQLPGSELLYLGPFETTSRSPLYHMDHLTCFVPGMLAIGAQVFDRPEDLMIAKGLLETCVYMYQSSATGLCPERWTFYELTTEVFNGRTYNKSKPEIRRDQYLIFHPKATEQELIEHEKIMAAKDNAYGDQSQPSPVQENEGLNPNRPRPQRPLYRGGGGDVMYLLRPETVESIYILYRITGDPKYQEYGWDIFQAIEKYCKTPTAFTSIRSVEFVPTEDEDIESNQMDSMESFFMAETLKYLYLLFSDDNVISLDKFVFNTEAHPLMRRPWTSASAASKDFLDPIKPPKQNITVSSTDDEEKISMAAKAEV